MTPLLSGQSVLLQGTGGISLFGLLLARAAGCTTIVTSSSDEKYDVDYTINYKTTPNWDEEVLKIANNKGVDVILKNGGVVIIKKSLNAVKKGGTISLIGVLGARENPEPVDVAFITLMKGCTLRGILVASQQQTEQLMNAIDQKKIKPPVTKVFD